MMYKKLVQHSVRINKEQNQLLCFNTELIPAFYSPILASQVRVPSCWIYIYIYML